MTKRQLIDRILDFNTTVEPSFLAPFDDSDLQEYLEHLERAQTPRLSGDPHRYDRYFQFDSGNGNAQRQWRREETPAEQTAQSAVDSDSSDTPADDMPAEQGSYAEEDSPRCAEQHQPVLVGPNRQDQPADSDDEKETWLF